MKNDAIRCGAESTETAFDEWGRNEEVVAKTLELVVRSAEEAVGADADHVLRSIIQ